MRTDKNRLFTIGQFAAIHEITKKTLMWYDETDLLKPSVIGENGYRYYTYNQSSALETILMLRELGVSIKEIKDFMSDRSANRMEKLLQEKITELESRISHLNNVRQTLINRHKDMMTLLNMDLTEISIVEKEKCYLAVIPTSEGESLETEIEMIIGETRKLKLNRLHDASYGAMISVDSLKEGKLTDYTALYVEVPCPISRKELYIRHSGKYLRAFCKGSWDKLPKRYKEILDYAQKKGLTLYGYSYETGINETVIDKFDDYITQIEIPVQEE